jgi:hypothetical protein
VLLAKPYHPCRHDSQTFGNIRASILADSGTSPVFAQMTVSDVHYCGLLFLELSETRKKSKNLSRHIFTRLARNFWQQGDSLAKRFQLNVCITLVHVKVLVPG